MEKITRFDKENDFLSNFYDAPVLFEGRMYLNNEAAFQSAKLADQEKRVEFEKMPPNVAKSQGRKVRLRADWEEVKDEVMLACVRDKFTRTPKLKEKLLATGEAELIEGNYWKDTYWGVCNGNGKNKLGKILMQVRSELREG